jgi:hypothetical protein
MKKLLQCISLGAVLAAGLFTGCNRGEAIDLKFNLRPGTRYINLMETKTVTDQTLPMGGSMKTTESMTMETSYEVAQAGGQDKQITFTYDRIAISRSNEMFSMKYDSREPDNRDTAMNMIGSLLHKPYSMVVSEKGEIRQVAGLDRIIAGMGDSTSEKGLLIRRQMSGIFNDSSVRAMMQQSFNIYPEGPVRKGATWKKSYTVANGPVNLKLDNEYKLVSITGGIAKIEVSAKITGAGTNIEGMQNVRLELSGTQKGDMNMEVATGMMLSSVLKQEISGQFFAMGTSIPTTIRSDIRITGSKK